MSRIIGREGEKVKGENIGGMFLIVLKKRSVFVGNCWLNTKVIAMKRLGLSTPG